MASIKEDSGSVHSAESREMGRERERERDREQENELLQSPSKYKTQTQAPETGACKGTEKYVRVRDMINLYNFAMQKNQELEQAKSILFGSSQEAKPDIPGDMPSAAEEEDIDGAVYGGQDGNPIEGQGSMSPDIGKLTVEKSYRSKTTLRRTDQGVRIIIDIFMDKNDSEIDIVGSRVETAIPESRVLADFQQQSLDMEKLKLKQEQAQGRKTKVHDQVDKRN